MHFRQVVLVAQLGTSRSSAQTLRPVAAAATASYRRGYGFTLG
jgi:hypothetical protein